MIGQISILIAIVLIIFLAMKGYNIIFIAPLCAIIVILLNGMDIYKAFVTEPNSYMMGLAKYIANYFAVFLLGSILAKYIEESGASKSIAKAVLSITGTEKPYPVLIAIFLISSVLTYGGISIFVVLFAILPLARPIFKQMDMSWSLITIPVFLGGGTFTMTMLPGSPAIQNVIPTVALGTTLTAAPLLGIIGTVVAIAFGLWYMKYELNKSIKNGENYALYTLKDAEVDVVVEDAKLPSIILSIAPLIVLIVICIGGSIIKIPNIILIGLITGCVLAGILYNSYISNHKTVINSGAQGAVMPIFLTSAAVGFGTVVTVAPGFKVISDAILNMPGNPLISLSVASSLITVITGSASGALGIIMNTFASSYVAMGIDPQVIHRIAVMASTTLTVMPHTGLVLSFFALAGLNHKNTFKKFFILSTGANTLALIAVLFSTIVLHIV